MNEEINFNADLSSHIFKSNGPKPKKFFNFRFKFPGNKTGGVLAGMVLLISGLIAGTLLVQQSQIFEEKALITTYLPSTLSGCIPLQRRCTGSSSTPKVEVCQKDGKSWSFGYNCDPGQVCNSTKTDCAAPISGFPSGPCVTGQKKCFGGISFVCFDGAWDIGASNLNCPKPPTSGSTYDCQMKNGYPVCTQTNPLWANNPFPNGCSNLDNNRLYLEGCGYATTCSVLCNCKRTAEYCNLDKCLKKDKLMAGYANCGGTGLHFTKNVLDQYPECVSTTPVKPDVFEDSNGNSLPIPEVSWKKVDQLLANGPVQIYGTFNYTAPNGDTFSIKHISLIVGKVNGKYVFNDTYFNPDNPDPKLQVNTSNLTDVMDINIENALGITE